MDEAEWVAEEIADYLAGGFALLWVVDPAARTIVVHRPGRLPATLCGGDDADGGEVLHGFRVRVGDLCS